MKNVKGEAVVQRTTTLLALILWGCFGSISANALLKSPISLLPLPFAEREEGAVTTRAQEPFPFVISAGTSVSRALHNHGMSYDEIQKVVEQAQALRDLNRVPAGTKFLVEKDPHKYWRVAFQFGERDVLEVRQLEDKRWIAHPYKVKIQKRVLTFKGVMRGSAYMSAQLSKVPMELIEQLRDIFQWQVNFARRPRHDKWRMTVEKSIVNDKTISWGPILAAEYITGDKEFRAVLYRKEGEKIGYFTPEGKPLKQPFLKSPVKEGWVTSLFQSQRLHPILHRRRPHLGVDYGAPTGTPVYAVADGTVRIATRRRQGGKTVVIRHADGFKTGYKHLSQFAKGVHYGAKIRQGQIIGYVGSTGLATGPHLHFELYQDGERIDPLKAELPDIETPPLKDLGDFQLQAGRLLLTLPTQVSSEVTYRTPAGSSEQKAN